MLFQLTVAVSAGWVLLQVRSHEVQLWSKEQHYKRQKSTVETQQKTALGSVAWYKNINSIEDYLLLSVRVILKGSSVVWRFIDRVIIAPFTEMVSNVKPPANEKEKRCM